MTTDKPARLNPRLWEWMGRPGEWRFVSSVLRPDAPLCPTGERVRWTRTHQHSHIYREILICLSGETTYGFKDRVYVCTPGTFFFFDRQERHDHHYPENDDEFDHLWLHFMQEKVFAHLVTSHAGRRRLDGFGKLLLAQRRIGFFEESVWPAVEQVRHLPEAVVRGRLIGIIGLLSSAIAEQIRRPRQVEPILQKDVVDAVKRHIRETAGVGESLDTLARLAGYSKYHFLRLFKKQCGMTVHEYIDVCRFEKIGVYRKEGFSQRQISEALGFSAPSAFSRWLRQQRLRS